MLLKRAHLTGFIQYLNQAVSDYQIECEKLSSVTDLGPWWFCAPLCCACALTRRYVGNLYSGAQPAAQFKHFPGDDVCISTSGASVLHCNKYTTSCQFLYQRGVSTSM